jgi:hypothetical protein
MTNDFENFSFHIYRDTFLGLNKQWSCDVWDHSVAPKKIIKPWSYGFSSKKKLVEHIKAVAGEFATITRHKDFDIIN